MAPAKRGGKNLWLGFNSVWWPVNETKTKKA